MRFGIKHALEIIGEVAGNWQQATGGDVRGERREWKDKGKGEEKQLQQTRI